MSLYRRGRVWWFEFVFNGRRMRKSTRQTDRRAASEIEAARRTALARQEAGLPGAGVTVREFARQFESLVWSECRPRTAEFYREKLRRLLEFEPLAGARLDRVDESLIADYIRARRAGGSRYGREIAPASINRELATLRRMLRVAFDHRLITRVPRIRLLRGERQREFVLARDREQEYLRALSPMLNNVAILMLDCGLRMREALGLTWENVKLEPRGSEYLYVPASVAKSGRSRTVPLTRRAARMLGALRIVSGAPGGKVFRVSASWLEHQHARVRRALGFPEEFVLHSLRHTYGTRLAEAGADVFTIMRLMGHASLAMAQRYVHPAQTGLVEAVRRMEGPHKSPHRGAKLLRALSSAVRAADS